MKQYIIKKYFTAKIKSYNDKRSTNFYNNGIPKIFFFSQCICLSEILKDVFFKVSKNFYPPVFLEQCKYAVKEKDKQVCKCRIRNFFQRIWW